MKRILVLLLVLSLSACSTMGHVQPVPKGGTIVIVSGLDNSITFDHVGLTVFGNESFQHNAPGLNINGTLINPLQASLRGKGYRTVVANVGPNSSLLKFNNGSITPAQKAQIISLAGGKKVDLAIFLIKSTPYVYGTPTGAAIGYGYFDVTFGTSTFASVLVFAANMDTLKLDASGVADLMETSSKNFYSGTAGGVNPAAISNLRSWLNQKFAPELIQKVNSMGV